MKEKVVDNINHIGTWVQRDQRIKKVYKNNLIKKFLVCEFLMKSIRKGNFLTFPAWF